MGEGLSFDIDSDGHIKTGRWSVDRKLRAIVERDAEEEFRAEVLRWASSNSGRLATDVRCATASSSGTAFCSRHSGSGPWSLLTSCSHGRPTSSTAACASPDASPKSTIATASPAWVRTSDRGPRSRARHRQRRKSPPRDSTDSRP